MNREKLWEEKQSGWEARTRLFTANLYPEDNKSGVAIEVEVENDRFNEFESASSNASWEATIVAAKTKALCMVAEELEHSLKDIFIGLAAGDYAQ